MSLLLLFRGGGGAPPEPPVVEPEVITGGGVKLSWQRAFAKEQRALERRYRIERARRELEEEIERLEAHLVETGTLPKPDVSSEVLRIAGLVESYRAESEALLPNRARRAFDYAERVQTEAAYRLALREYLRLLEEEEMALLLVLSLD